MTKFIKQSDKRRTYIVEGEEKPNQVFSITRFICEIQKQETEKETQQVANLVLAALIRSKPMPFTVKIPVGPEDVDRFVKWCGHYDYNTIQKRGDPYIEVNGEDPLNLYWLGANMMAPPPTSLLTKNRF